MTQFPSIFGNALNEGNQNNVQQQMPSSNFAQPVQGKQVGSNVCQQPRNTQNDYGIMTNGLYTSQQQNMQQPMIDSYASTNPNSSSLYYNNYYVPGNGKQAPQPLPIPTIQGYGFLPQNILDQMRSYTTNSSPIFILPNGVSNSNTVPSCPLSILPPTCIPYPMPLPMFQPPESKPKESECKCSTDKSRNCFNEIYEKQEKNNGTISRVDYNCESCNENCFKQNVEDAVCSKQNCPASIQLQAMVSQLLGIQGIISSTITRLLLKKISSSNITDTVEEIMEWATKSIRQLGKDQLLNESKNSHEVNGLLRLYLTSSSTLARIIPILTSAQLKSNVLKALVENLINARIIEDQGYGAETPEPLDVLILELKTDDELRQLLSILREKECQERVNLSFAAYNSQRLIAESRLTNVQRKIAQIEKEMDRRHSNGTDQESSKKVDLNFCKYNYDASCYNKSNNLLNKNFKSPDPFMDIHIPNPKKLLLKPHVGSPETTYAKSNYIQKLSSTKPKIENLYNCSSVCAKNISEEKSCIESWEHKNALNKKMSNESCTSNLLENKIGCNNQNLIDFNCHPNLENGK